jgi:hypothetical protein
MTNSTIIEAGMLEGQRAFRRKGSAGGCDSSNLREYDGCRSVVGIVSSSKGQGIIIMGRLRLGRDSKPQEEGLGLLIHFHSEQEGDTFGEQGEKSPSSIRRSSSFRWVLRLQLFILGVEHSLSKISLGGGGGGGGIHSIDDALRASCIGFEGNVSWSSRSWCNIF